MPAPPQRTNADKDEEGVQQMQHQVLNVVGAWIKSEEAVVDSQRKQRQRMVIAQREGTEEMTNAPGIQSADRIIGRDVPVVVPRGEAVAE